MTDVALERSGQVRDISIVNGALQLVEDDDAIVQRVELKSLAFQGDWFLDLLFGIPYYGRIFTRGVNETDILNIYQNAYESMPEIQRVEEISMSVDTETRVMHLTARLLADTGTTVGVNFPTIQVGV